MSLAKTTKNRNIVKTYLIISNVIFGVLIFPNLFLIMMSAMLFDSPGSQESMGTVALAVSIISYPFITIFGIVLGWIFFYKQKYTLSLVFGNLSLLSIFSGICAFLYIFVICDGNFSC